MQECQSSGTCFTHTGSFALNAGYAGAKEVTGVDASQLAVDQATANAALNGLSDSVKFICEDVFDLLPKLEEKGEKYDVVILDPPAFTKSRSSVKNAVKGYREINLRAMKLVKMAVSLQPVPVHILWITSFLPRPSGRLPEMCINVSVR